MPIPGKLERELHDIARRLKEDAARREEIVVELLRLGCTQRDIGAAAGLTHGRVYQIGKKHGWPPPDLEQRRREERERATESARKSRESWVEFERKFGANPDWRTDD